MRRGTAPLGHNWLVHMSLDWQPKFETGEGDRSLAPRALPATIAARSGERQCGEVGPWV
jgi:hypothetical protein